MKFPLQVPSVGLSRGDVPRNPDLPPDFVPVSVGGFGLRASSSGLRAFFVIHGRRNARRERRTFLGDEEPSLSIVSCAGFQGGSGGPLSVASSRRFQGVSAECLR